MFPTEKVKVLEVSQTPGTVMSQCPDLLPTRYLLVWLGYDIKKAVRSHRVKVIQGLKSRWGSSG